MFISLEYGVSEEFICEVDIVWESCLGEGIFYFFGKFFPISFVVVCEGSVVLVEFEVVVGVDGNYDWNVIR